MTAKQRILFILIGAASIYSTHLAGYVKISAFLLLTSFFMPVIIIIWKSPSSMAWKLCQFLLMIGVVWLADNILGIEKLIGGLPALVMAILSYLFGRTLVKGRTPLITRFSTATQPILPEGYRAYTRTHTRIWAILFALFAIGVFFVVPMVLISIVVMVLLFLGEHWYGCRKFGVTISPLASLKACTNLDLWLSDQ